MTEIKTCERCGKEYEDEEGNWKFCNMCILKNINENKTDLKTLNDICRSGEDEEAISILDLKAEAIKWVKEIRRNGLSVTNIFDKKGVTIKEWDELMISWIEHFFNLTEDDLQ
jgi:aryl carrier-like protein